MQGQAQPMLLLASTLKNAIDFSESTYKIRYNVNNGSRIWSLNFITKGIWETFIFIYEGNMFFVYIIFHVT